jgi:hypothetical protein
MTTLDPALRAEQRAHEQTKRALQAAQEAVDTLSKAFLRSQDALAEEKRKKVQ